ncbi:MULTISPECIES: hypothetical protein [Bradyrhizobium]|nr:MULTISPECIES: hypothetical protein [Bradyrhizobium]QIO99408.1 hypothetical protein HAU86_06145 [Bradyrhizobium symbiodeficiens]UPJ60932.1 hypothetical protein IVB24_15585 [Bradyrhizobium sp. 192]
MTEPTRPTPAEVDAAARVLHEIGLRHRWWSPYEKTYDELSATDLIGKEEFDAIAEAVLLAAAKARHGQQS